MSKTNKLNSKQIQNQSKTHYTISKDMMISELVRSYPEIGQMLSYEWGFHCVNCFISEYETIEQGALTHGIIDNDFETMMKMINDMANELTKSLSPKH